MTVFLIILAIVSVFAISRPLTCFIHEMGHAIPALIFTKEKVDVFVGSYGDEEDGIQLQLGRLRVYFNYNLLTAYAGLCRHQGGCNLWQNLLIILGGPMASLVAAVISLLMVYSVDTTELIRFLTIVFACSAGIDFFANIRPEEKMIIMHDRQYVYNDGRQILELLGTRKYSASFFTAEELLRKDKFEEALSILEMQEEAIINKKRTFEYRIFCNVELSRFQEAISLHKAYVSRYKADHNDMMYLAVANIGLDNFHKALKIIEKVLSREWNNVHAISNRGTIYRFQGRIEMAHQDFSQAIVIQPDYSYVLSARGGLMAERGYFDEAQEDLEKAALLTPDNRFVDFNYGIFYLERGEPQEALKHLMKAKSHNRFVYGLEDSIAKAESLIIRQSAS